MSVISATPSHVERDPVQPGTAAPAFRSLALIRIPNADYVDVVFLDLPTGVTTDPVRWTQAVFSVRDTPAWIKALFVLREGLVPLIGVPQAPEDVFTVREVSGEEALVCAQDRHLDFAAGVGVDAEQGYVRLTTTVRLHGWRGALYFAPVRVLHRPVCAAMLRRAAKQLALATSV